MNIFRETQFFHFCSEHLELHECMAPIPLSDRCDCWKVFLYLKEKLPSNVIPTPHSCLPPHGPRFPGHACSLPLEKPCRDMEAVTRPPSQLPLFFPPPAWSSFSHRENSVYVQGRDEAIAGTGAHLDRRSLGREGAGRPLGLAGDCFSCPAWPSPVRPYPLGLCLDVCSKSCLAVLRLSSPFKFYSKVRKI